MSARRTLEYAVLGLILAGSSYAAAVSSAPMTRWSSLGVAVFAAALAAGLHHAHGRGQEYPEWMRPGARRQLYFVAFVIMSGVISSAVYILTTPQETPETVTSEALAGFFLTVIAWGSLSAYRKEKRRVADLGEGAGPMPTYSIIPYSWSRYLFISLMAVTGGLAVIYTMGLASYVYPTNPLVASLMNSNSPTVTVPYVLAAAIGAYAGYRISRTKWMVEGMFVWIVAWGFWMGSLFGLLGAQQANLFHDSGRTAELLNMASVAVGVAVGYALTRTKWYGGWKGQFLFDNGALSSGDGASIRAYMTSRSAADRALRGMTAKEEAALYQSLEEKEISELTDLEFAERLELAETLPDDGSRAKPRGSKKGR